MSADPLRILLVEDDEVDVKGFSLALEVFGANHDLMVARTAEEGLDALRQCAAKSGRELPLVMLDLNLPGRSGFSFLEEVRQDAALNHAVVLVCTASTCEEDRARAERLQADAYLQKNDPSFHYKTAYAVLDRCWHSPAA